MSRVVAAINPVLPGLARRKGVAHHPHGGSLATWTLTLAIRLVWLGPVAAERAVAEDARGRGLQVEEAAQRSGWSRGSLRADRAFSIVT